jgi:riboflavin kinase/FMN adenylyltransferase
MPSAPRIFHSPEEALGHFGPCALTAGNFDGVHCGHRRLFREVTQIASANGWEPSVLTFDPHPTKVVAPERAPKLLTTIAQRCRYMGECGITQVLVLPFDLQLASLEAEDFVRRILVEALQAKAVVVGDNFRFGHRQSGDVHTLARLGMEYHYEFRALPAVTMRGVVVSSSEIRRRIQTGDVAGAAHLLGRFVSVEGEVVKGHGVGARQTVPTLNIEATAEVLPAVGVYVTRTMDLESDRVWPSVTNVGFRPTFGGKRLAVETYVLEPLEEAPSRIRVELTRRLRDERRFENPEVLKAQILHDVERARKWHRRWNNARLMRRMAGADPYTGS